MQQPYTDPGSGQNVQQQMNQQMVLCPVRLVYETQILVQPGDQIQPNQTIIVNHQNTPPWVQNSPIQNQMIYVQQYPTGHIIPTIQPQINQNQIYAQQNMANFQHVLAQNLQDQQLRPSMQLTNMIPSNMGMMASMQTNLSPNIQTVSNQKGVQTLPNIRPAVPNTIQNMDNIRNIVPNSPKIAPNMHVTMPQQLHQVVMTPPKQIQPQNLQSTYRNAGPQTVRQQNNMARSQIPNQIQNQSNMTNLQQFLTNAPNFAHNMDQRNPALQQNNNIQSLPPVSTNVTVPTGGTIIRKLIPTTNVTKSSNNLVSSTQSNLGVRNYTPYPYRAIQPRPLYGSTLSVSPTFVPNLPLSQTSNILPNAPNIGVNTIRPLNQSPNLINPNILSTPNNTAAVNDNPPVNRKRKSESPDIFRKKMFIASQDNNNAMLTVQENKSASNNPNSSNIVNSKEINTNIAPDLSKMEDKSTSITTSMSQINPHNIQLTKASYEQSANIKLIPQNEGLPADIEKTHVKDAMQQTDKEKLVRNTVFPQARGRLLNDKQNIPVTVVKCQNDINTNKGETVSNAPKIVSTSTSTENVSEKTELKETNDTINRKRDEETNIDINTANNNTTDDNRVKCDNKPYIRGVDINKTDSNKVDNGADNNRVDNKRTDNNRINNNRTDTKRSDNNEADHSRLDNNRTDDNRIDNNRSDNSRAHNTKTKNNKVANNKRNDNIVSINDMRGKEIHITDGNIKKQERIDSDFLLTHVLDGYVIQESNVAFPIRKPLIERLIYANTKTDLEYHKRDQKTDRMDIIKDNSKILNVSLNLLEDEINRESKKNENMDNPFATLSSSIVKKWTISQLEAHLSNYDWRETVSLFREHEIDGESLFLVSKSQLITIGVDENHADIICEFVKS